MIGRTNYSDRAMRGNWRFEKLKGILYTHVKSTVNVDTILKRVIEEECIDPAIFERRHLEQVFNSVIFTSIRLFCDEETLPVVMLALAELVEQ